MIITIARQCGCEGDEVGRKLSEIYGIPCYSKKELIELAKEKKVYDKYPFYFGERQVDDMMSMVADDMNLKVHDTDRRRKQYHNYYSGETWGLADNYDLCLDECKLGIDGVAAVVSAYIGQIDGKD